MASNDRSVLSSAGGTGVDEAELGQQVCRDIRPVQLQLRPHLVQQRHHPVHVVPPARLLANASPAPPAERGNGPGGMTIDSLSDPSPLGARFPGLKPTHPLFLFRKPTQNPANIGRKR